MRGGAARILCWLCLHLVASLARAQTEVSLGGELAFFAGDDDAFRATEASVPSSPPASFGERAGYAFAVDELAPRGSRAERLLALHLTLREPTRFAGVSTAAGVHTDLVPQRGSADFGVADGGSYLEIERRLGQVRDLFRVHPINGDALRVGWLETLGWGGESGALGESPYARAGGFVPAAIYRHEQPVWGVHAGAKTALMNVPGPDGLEREQVQYGLFGGGELRPLPNLELGIQGGYFEHGALPQPDVRGEPLATGGLTVRAMVRDGVSEPTPLGLFPRAEPARERRVRYALAVEAAALLLHLKQAEFTGLARWVPARAGALVFELSAGEVRVVSGLTVRDLAFVTRQGPGALLPEAPPVRLPVRPEGTAFIGGRFELGESWTAGLDCSLRLPAAMAIPGSGAAGARTLLVHGPGRVTLLPERAEALPVFEVRGSAALNLSSLLTGVLFLQYRRDTNAVLFARPPGEPVFEAQAPGSPDAFGYGAALRAGF